MFGLTAYNLVILSVGVREILRRKHLKEHDGKHVKQCDLPFFSLIVPMKDEKKVGGRILEAMMKIDYPSDKYEVMVVDDGSVDGTSDICREYEDVYPDRIRYLRRNVSLGKAAALNYGLKSAKGEIIGVFDADNVPEPDVLRNAAECFMDRGVVAVQGLLSSINAEENMLTKFIHYKGLIQHYAFNSGKDKLGLFVAVAGTCQFVRREVLEEVGGWVDGALTEDMDLSARLTEKGYSVEFAPDVRSWQENASKFSQFMKQRVRWCRGCMEVAFKYGKLLKHIDKRSFDAEVFFTGPFMMLFVLATYVLGLYMTFVPFNLGVYVSLLTQFMSVLTLFTLFILGMALAYTSSPRRISNVQWLPFMYLYWAIEVLVSFYAFLQIIFRRPRKWVKTSRTGVVTNQ